MKIRDPLYGEFQLDSRLGALVTAPEVRRLSQIRLLNTLTPSLATLGEIRRFSHTLGVLFLARRCALPGYSARERSALQAAVLLHDVCTPPFGHLMEYHLRERTGWSHEAMIQRLLDGRAVPENTAHQVFGGQQIRFRRLLHRAKIDEQLVADIVERRHPLHLLLFGSLDLDNLDNVARMSWAMGNPDVAAASAALASLMGCQSEGAGARLTLPEANARALVAEWAAARAAAYQVLVFDGPTVAAQAVLSRAIGSALDEGAIGEDDWDLTDETLIQRLAALKSTKKLMRQYLGELPRLVFALQAKGTPGGHGAREALTKMVDECMAPEFPSGLAYAFHDKGAFSKELAFWDPEAGAQWTFGKRSESIVLYAFARYRGRPDIAKCRTVAERVQERLGVSPSQLRIGDDEETDQRTLPF